MDMEHKRNDMQMTDDEIRGSMRKAADKRAQVGILAELNAVSEDQMRAKLTELGVAVPGRKPRTTRAMDPEQALALIGQGLTDAEISRRLGVNSQTVGEWRRAQGIPANSRRKLKRAPEPGPSPAVPAEPAGTAGAGTVPGCAGGARRHNGPCQRRAGAVRSGGGGAGVGRHRGRAARAVSGPAGTGGRRPGHHRPGRGIERGVPG